MHVNSLLLFDKYAKQCFSSGMRVLEIGPDQYPSTYQKLIDDSSISWETIDLYPTGNLTHMAISEYSFPLPDHSYDVVVSANVIEHVRKIWVWIKELARICKPGGLIITVNPTSWPYHEAPIDCWRIYPEGMKTLYEEAGLETLISQNESLELPEYEIDIPGKSPEWQDLEWRMLNQILGTRGFPVERAYDTITIGRKPLS